MFLKNIKLSRYSNYRIGGRASYFFEAKNIEEIKSALGKWRAIGNGKPIFIFGGGTNLLINDDGFDGLVLKIFDGGLTAEGEKIRAGAGIQMSELLNYSITRSLSGLEWAGGLPGTVGGAVRGNAGAFSGETKDNILEVISLDISGKNPKLVKRSAGQCQFGYRNSVYKINDGREIILEAVFGLKKGDGKIIAEKIGEKIAYRISRQPLEYPNIGSIFKNVDLRLVPPRYRKKWANIVKSDPFPVLPTAHIISEAGLKGVSCGGAMISPKHPNFIVNVLDASSEDVKKLIKLVKGEVKRKFEVILEEEVIYL